MQLAGYDLDVRTLHVSRVSHGKAAGKNLPTEPIPEDAPIGALGSTGRSTWGGVTSKISEYLPELKGRRGILMYDQMRSRDSQVRSSLLLVKMPVLSAEWWVEPFSDDDEDQAVAEFVWWALNNCHKEFMSILKEALYCLDYGHYVLEPEFEIVEYTPPRKWGRARTVAKWVDFAPRHPLTMNEPEYDDRFGRFKGWWHYPGGRRSDRMLLPADRILVFTWDEEADDPRGKSILRSAYENYYYKHHLYSIDGIQKERHGIGIPDIELQHGYSPDDKKLAHEMGRSLRTNERAYVVRTPQLKIGFLDMPTGQLADALESAKHHGGEITVNVLTQFINTATEGRSGREMAAQTDVFVKALRYLTKFVAGVFNHQAIPQLVDYNFKVKGYPRLRARRVGEAADLRALAVALRNLAEPGIITPGPTLERYSREVFDLPIESDDDVDRSSAARERGGGDEPEDEGEGPEPTNPNRPGPGNQARGRSPRGRPTE